MLDNGTVMNNKLVESPKSFQVACTVMTQIIAAVASSQYGGQSVDISHLGKYLRKSYEKYKVKTIEKYGDSISAELLESIINDRIKDELKSGVQTIQYQINTLMTTNGQSPFVTLFLNLDTNSEYVKENAMIIEEIIKQRLEGIKNEKGVYITPAFPKLVYVLDEHNCLKGGEYDYLTKLAVKCSAKRLYPDYISAKKMRENYEGNVFSPMGCVDGKEVIPYRFMGITHIESFERMWNNLSTMFSPQLQNPNQEHLYMDVKGVEVFDTKTRQFTEVKRVIRNISNEWVNIKFSNGRVLRCTSDHPFETENRGIVYAKDLTNEDILLVNKTRIPTCEFNTCELERAWLLGFLLCDGCYASSVTASIDANGEDDIQERFIYSLKLLYNVEVKVVERDRGPKGHYKDLIVKGNGDGSIKLRYDLIQLFGGIKKSDRHIPDFIWSSNEPVRLAFMAGMMDADGYINNSEYNESKVQIGSTNKELAIQQMYLLQSIDYRSSIYMNHYNTSDVNKVRYRVECKIGMDLVRYMACEKKKMHFTPYIVDNRNNSIYYENICSPTEIIHMNYTNYSYDVTTESEHFEISGLYSHNCRSFLSTWKDENGNYKFEGRFNKGKELCPVA